MGHGVKFVLVLELLICVCFYGGIYIIFCHFEKLGFIFNQGEKLHIFGGYKLIDKSWIQHPCVSVHFSAGALLAFVYDSNYHLKLLCNVKCPFPRGMGGGERCQEVAVFLLRFPEVFPYTLSSFYCITVYYMLIPFSWL